MIATVSHTGINHRQSTYSVHDVIDRIADLDLTRTTPEAMHNTIATWGSSKTSPEIARDMELSRLLIADIVKNGHDVVSGCGKNGMMGTFLYTAKEHSRKDFVGRPIQNLVLVMNPPYGEEILDEDACIPIGKAPTEAERIKKFLCVADNILVQKGSTATLNEAVSSVGVDKNIILVCREFFSGLTKQFDSLFRVGFTKYPAEDLFVSIDAEDKGGILQEIHNPARHGKKLSKDGKPAIKEFSDCYVVYEGGIETVQKVVSLINDNSYAADKKIKRIFLVGDFFTGLKEQYQAIINAKVMRRNPQEVFEFISTKAATKFGRLL